MFSTFVIMTSVSVLKVVVTSAEFASFKPFLMSLHMPLTQVMWSSGGVVVESERLHLCGCHWKTLVFTSSLLVVFSVMATTDISVGDCGFGPQYSRD